MSTGPIFGEPHEVYHAHAAHGSHDLADLEPYPLLFFKAHVEKSIPARADTDALKFGRYFHTLALEGEAVTAERYVSIPSDAPPRPQERHRNAKKPSPDTLAGFAYWDAFEAANKGREVVATDAKELAWRMVQSIREKPGVRALFAEGSPEVTFRHQMASFQVQCRADWWNPNFNNLPAIIDVKTIDSLAAFDAQFFNYAYYRQAAFYLMVTEAVMGVDPQQHQHLFVVVEKKEPYQTAVRAIDAASLQVGRQEVVRLLTKLKGCYDSGVWPGEPDEIRPVALPLWKLNKELT